MTYIKYYIPLILFPLLASCSGKTQAERNREDAEQEGARLLSKARECLKANDYESARQNIIKLRRDIPLALDARRQGILLLDSIELAAARDSVRFLEGESWERLNLKVQFYERKLKEDLKGYGDKQ